MKKRLVFVLGILLLAAGLVWSGGAGEKEKEVILVGTSAGFRPFEYKEFGTLTGFDIDLMNEIGAKLGKEVEFKDMDFDALLEALNAGTVDVIASGMTIYDERKERADFTVPYFTANQAALVKKGSGIVLSSVEDLNNAKFKIGVQNDTTGAFWVEDNAPDVTLQKYGKYIECIQDLENGNIDIIVVDQPVAEAFAVNRPVVIALPIITNEQYGLALQKGSSLYEPVNNALKELMASPKWDELLDKYFGAK
ncbi:MAG: basic amino acid ABC transporter substrate-binding protein [Spirochaetales bacterium]|nr:basic amino acid ABC transporter substrate-binding protein [Spirochaetales bacterium]